MIAFRLQKYYNYLDCANISIKKCQKNEKLHCWCGFGKDAQQDNQRSASKILRNGQLFIIHEGKEYNATGFRTR